MEVNQKFCWEGADYGKRLGPKLLVLGESQFEPVMGTCEPGKLIKQEISEERPPKKSHRFYTMVFQTVTGEKKARARKTAFREFWNSIIFYNFVQFSVGNKARIRPTSQMWQDSKAPFLNAVRKYKPDAILALGDKLWRRLKAFELIGVPASSHDGVFKLNVDSLDCWITMVNHPSWPGFSWEDYHKQVAQLLARANCQSGRAE